MEDLTTVGLLIEKAPYIAANILIVWWFLRSNAKERDANARERTAWMEVIRANTAVISELKGIISQR
jgi:hypothetical protein